jgi:hypothetical protein
MVGDLVMNKIHHPATVQEHIIKIIKELGYTSITSVGVDESAVANEEDE